MATHGHPSTKQNAYYVSIVIRISSFYVLEKLNLRRTYEATVLEKGDLRVNQLNFPNLIILYHRIQDHQ